VLPVLGGHRNIRAIIGAMHAPILNTRITMRAFLRPSKTHPTLKRRMIIDALTIGIIGVCIRLTAIRIWDFQEH
jgi:hypothetical protein